MAGRHARRPPAARAPMHNDQAPRAARVGKGRVAFLPQLLTPAGGPADLVGMEQTPLTPFNDIRPEKWRMPLNAVEMLQLLEWAAGGYRFNALVPNTVAVEFASQSNPRRYLVHLVNFDLERDVGPFEISCAFAVKRAQAFTPDAGKPPRVRVIRVKKEKTLLQIDGFHRYLIVAVTEA